MKNRSLTKNPPTTQRLARTILAATANAHGYSMPRDMKVQGTWWLFIARMAREAYRRQRELERAQARP